MMNKKRILQIVAIFAFLMFFSCAKNVEKLEDNQQNKTSAKGNTEKIDVEQSDFSITIPKDQLSSFFVSYNNGKTLRSTETTNIKKNREEAIAALMDKFIPYAMSKIDRDKYEIASFVLKNDKEKGIVQVENVTIYMPEKMGPMALGLFLAFAPAATDIDTTATKRKETLKLSCEGGKNDGKYIIIDQPTEKLSTIKFANEIADFSEKCLDGEEGAKVCKVEMSIF